MALSNEVAYMSASELALRIRRRDLSPVEVVDAFIARIEARNPSINAFVYLGFDDARQRANEPRIRIRHLDPLEPHSELGRPFRGLVVEVPSDLEVIGDEAHRTDENVVDAACVELFQMLEDVWPEPRLSRR